MKSYFSTILLVCFLNLSFAGEGMWIPLLLKSLNEAEMQQMGMKLTAEDIYSINQGSLKDAIVHFGGFCTSEIISSQGLLLTNHHCGYGQIQSHSSLENNLLKNGFWASNLSEELPNPGLTATLIDRIIDVSKEALMGVSDDMSMGDRQSQIDKNLDAIRAQYDLADYQDIIIRPFFHGNQYFAFITTTYRDIRLVGAPSESIGKFGADTDNWVWPRHTGDFALFRIYAGQDNLPADYSENNVPYKPKHHLPISLDGVEEGDFTMVFGFPGRTQEYLPAVAVEQIVNVSNPAKISIREKALNIIDKYMRSDEATRIKYASKFASVANYWKKWIGESKGIKRTRGIEKKRAFEKEFQDKLAADSPYANLLSEFDALYKEQEPLAYVRDYYSEVTGRNIELMRIVSIARRLVSSYENNGEEGYNGFKGRVVPWLENFYKNYDPTIDQEVFSALVNLYTEKVDHAYFPEVPPVPVDYAEEFYKTSAFTTKDKMMEILNMSPADAVAKLKEDPVYQFGNEWNTVYTEKVSQPMNKIRHQLDSLQRLYMKALMETFPDRRFYPDANSTLRITYGKVDGYNPADAVRYSPITYFDGVIEKYKPGDYEFDVSDRMLEVYDQKDYGQYTDKTGKVPVCFIGTNHTTGGNSGSPAIDGIR